MNRINNNISKTKQHFDVLDGLRGIAALAVVIFHFMEIIYSDYTKNFIAHGFLAVDFFFCLSGFVIGYAYDNRIKKIGIKEFFKLRIIRLHPLVILGSILGLLCFLLDPFINNFELHEIKEIILIFISSIFLIPLPIMPERYFNLFSFNAPAWSLFWEYIANILYAFILYKISRNILILLTLISAFGICLVSYYSGSLIGGWGKESFFDGSARISYSFLIGLLVYRSNFIIKTKIGFIGMSLLLILAFIMPYSKWNWLIEPIIVLFYFPLLISLGAGTILNKTLKKICIFLGKISYPLYMTHYSVMWIFANYYNTYKTNTIQLLFIVTTSTILLVIIAYITMKIYDIPIQKYLSKN